MNDFLLIISGLLSLVILVVFFSMSSKLAKIKFLLEFPSALKATAISKVIAGSADARQAVLEFLVAYAIYVKPKVNTKSLASYVERNHKELVDMSGISIDEIKAALLLL